MKRTGITGIVCLAALCAQAELRIGIVGLDTSHSVNFTKLLNEEKPEAGLEGARVTVAYPQGSKDIFSSTNRVPGYIEQMKKMGVKIVPSMTALLAECDGVLLESNDGRVHPEQAEEIFKAGKPCFIDKPLAADLQGALAIDESAKKYHAAFFSCSSLRYGVKAQEVRAGKHGTVRNVTAWSPCYLEEHHNDFTWYGIHGVEELYAILGKGCRTVSRVSTTNTETIVGTWADGRVGTLLGNRAAPYRIGFGAFTDKEILYEENAYSQIVECNLLKDVVKFFKTRVPPIPPEETLEMFAYMEAADVSKRRGGKPTSLAETLAETRGEGFAPLFNGKDLTGWIGATNGYGCENGILFSLPKTSENLMTAKEYRDFILRFEFRLTENANNGIGIRCPAQCHASQEGMCELQILDDGGSQYTRLQPYQYTGSVYGIVPARKDNPCNPCGSYLKPLGEWNTQEVRVEGPHIAVMLNGTLIVNEDTAEILPPYRDHKPHPGFRNTSGHIGLLGHGSRVDFRNLRIKEL